MERIRRWYRNGRSNPIPEIIAVNGDMLSNLTLALPSQQTQNETTDESVDEDAESEDDEDDDEVGYCISQYCITNFDH
jgi:hypothetical protein